MKKYSDYTYKVVRIYGEETLEKNLNFWKQCSNIKVHQILPIDPNHYDVILKYYV